MGQCRTVVVVVVEVVVAAVVYCNSSSNSSSRSINSTHTALDIVVVCSSNSSNSRSNSTHTALDIGQTSDCSRMLGYEIQAELCQNGAEATQPKIYQTFYQNI